MRRVHSLRSLAVLSTALITALALLAAPAAAVDPVASEFDGPAPGENQSGVPADDAAAVPDVAGSGTASTDVPAPDVVIRGAGWGHGVGMSQYGALGLALEGKRGARIIKYFYTGAKVRRLADLPLPDTSLIEGEDPLWVGITGLRNRTRVTFAPLNARLFVCQSDDGEGECPKRAVRPYSSEWPVDADERWSFEVVDEGRCQFFRDGVAIGSEGGCRASIAWSPRGAISVGGTQYRRGEIKIRPVPDPITGGPHTTEFHVSLAIGLEQYMYGLAEVPTGWPQAALRAQALAGRSYAAYRYLQYDRADRRTATDPGLTESRKIQCWCHLFSTAIDQAYGAYDHERRPYWGEWRRAVNRTRGRVVSHETEINTISGVAQAFYSSSTGGATENSEDKWVTAVPYLRTRPDPWSLDPDLNPYHSWERTVSLSSLSATLGFSEIADIEIAEVYASGSPKRIVVTGADGSASTYTGSSFAGRVGLRSHYVRSITIEGDDPDPPPPPEPPPNPPPAEDPPESGVGLHDPASGDWQLRSPEGDVVTFKFGDPADVPFTGDWDCDGVTNPGLFRVSAGFLFLRNSNTQGAADTAIFFGDPGDLPVAGDWDGDGCDTIGVFRPGDGAFYLRNENSAGAADVTVAFGRAGDVPVAGDWNGDGVDTVGVYRPSNKTLYLTNSHAPAAVDVEFLYSGARAGDKILVGDWDGDGNDTSGVYRPADRAFYLRDTYTQPHANITIVMGEGHMSPVAGHWGS